ncbi:Antitoxin of toxin-antitoxin stability system [Bordetella ansorpii]|uniref:Antitoxin of toxin-antitoxin stability system n=1 Tax=Bordetella ansorpii TaxID=288768 RepID=A0A157SRA6_9BORD|nr:transposase [Bordetella ansorpii]SAI73000.1 Antitoxin of toxin-antitoxin stability system [Bordetella ansorpii]
MKMDCNTVSVSELNGDTSKILDRVQAAQCIKVTKNGQLCAYVISPARLQRDREYLNYIPATDPLFLLRDALEFQLSKENDPWREVADLGLAVSPRYLAHALLLQLLYSIPSLESLYRQIGVNMAFREFVGIDSGLSLWPYPQFERGAQILCRTRIMVRLGEFALSHPAVCADKELRINESLLDGWRKQGTTDLTQSTSSGVAGSQAESRPLLSLPKPKSKSKPKKKSASGLCDAVAQPPVAVKDGASLQPVIGRYVASR